MNRIMDFFRRPETIFLCAVAGIAIVLHLFLLPQLNIIEDESAYMQDAAQITPSFLPFRDFGGTKGPLWLFIFHAWQKVFGYSLLATRLFSSLAHVGSIFLFWHLVRSFPISRGAVYISTALWGLSAVVISLTTNITHIPLELVCIFAGFLLLRSPRSHAPTLAALFLFAALLMRASAIAFVPAALVLIFIRNDRWKALLRISIAFFAVLLITIAIVYPLYGWPKTAFFFNADATLIANKQRAAYATVEPVSPFQMLYNAALPLRLDGKSILFPALFFPLVIIFQIVWKKDWSKQLVLLLLAWVGSFILFYKGWGRSPTPFYPLESIPALSVAAALTLDALWSWGKKVKLGNACIIAFLLLFLADSLASYQDIPVKQYRGTVEVQAAQGVADILKQQVRPGEHVFTAQPSYVYLAGLPLYGGYTHPGWYLSERAGYLPTEIRRVFLPDFEILAGSVEKDITWIVADWRTNDVYFNEGAPVTADLRAVLSNSFEKFATVENPASRDIVIYKRK